MSSLSVSGVGQDSYQLIQRVNDQTASTGATPTSGDCAGGMSADGASESPSGQHHRHHHHGGGDAGELVSQLLDIIGSSLKSAQNSGQDPNQVVENTVAQLLSGNAPDAAGSAGTPALSAGGAGPTAGSTPPAPQSFTQLLQSYGISLDQFREDLLAAVQDAKNGNVNPGTALQSLPQGATVNAVA